MFIGKRIYYDKETGREVQSVGEYFDSGLTSKLPIEQDIETYKSLSERNRGSFDVIELEYGQYAQDFAESNSYRVNPETKELEFFYPDPNEPEAPPAYQKPLSEQIAEMKAESESLNTAVIDLYEIVLGGM